VTRAGLADMRHMPLSSTVPSTGGVEPGATSAELAELTAAKQRIRELEIEVAIHRHATEELKEDAYPKAVRGHRRG